MPTVHAGITDPNPKLAELSLSYGMLLIVIINLFNSLLYRFKSVKPGVINAASTKLMKLDDPVPLSSQPSPIVPSCAPQSSLWSSRSILFKSLGLSIAPRPSPFFPIGFSPSISLAFLKLLKPKPL